jgi:hypothetical protein
LGIATTAGKVLELELMWLLLWLPLLWLPLLWLGRWEDAKREIISWSSSANPYPSLGHWPLDMARLLLASFRCKNSV